jgi:hypothetical protein
MLAAFEATLYDSEESLLFILEPGIYSSRTCPLSSRRSGIVSGSLALAPSGARTIYDVSALCSQDGCEYFYQSNDDVEMVTPGWAPFFVSALRSLSSNPFSLALILASPSFPLHRFPAIRSYGPACLLT